MNYKVGYVFTIFGKYKGYPIWGWIKNKPKELQQFCITEECASYSEYKPLQFINNQKVVS